MPRSQHQKVQFKLFEVQPQPQWVLQTSQVILMYCQDHKQRADNA
jgi:hypothetical protein